jgi:D-alanyl-D-alanine carboxypeptidase-like protein
MTIMTRFASISVAFAVVIAACSQTPAGERTEPRPDAALGEIATETPAVRTGSVLPAPATPEEEAQPPRFEGGVSRIGPALRRVLVGRSWHQGCPVPIEDLRQVRVSYWDFHGEVRTGPLVVNEMVAHDILWVFKQLFRAKFPIKRVVLPPKYHPPRPQDYWNKNPTSPTGAFNCRPATGSTSLSHHSYGWAIDINPLQNPYVRSDGTVLRRIAKPYRDRSLHRKGMIHESDIAVRSFARIGWEWGGHWQTLKDYMHFSLTGR